MSMFGNFKMDPVSEKDGVWLDYGEFRVRISRAGGSNKDYAKKMERLTRPYRRAIATGTLDPAVSMGILHKAYATAVIRDWETKVDGEFVKGIEQSDSDELAPVNTDSVVKVLNELPELFLDIKEQAEGIALFRAAIREEAAGN